VTKHVRRGATVDAHEVTEKNLEKLAADHGGVVHTSVREEGKQYVLFESEDGTLRVDVGGYLILDADGKVVDGYRDPVAFAADYERP
jgi:hypothetical protein